ncbi:TPA: hypothetical protein ACX6PR_001326 [Photobacterium damselae]
MAKNQKVGLIIAMFIFPFLGATCFWVFWDAYVAQILNPSSEIIGDPFYIISIAFGASVFIGGFSGVFALVNLFLCIKEKQIFRLASAIDVSYFRKGILILAIGGGGFAFISNIILIHKIIPEDGYVLCPKKVGYKKNLLRDYVLDPSKCERF